MQHEDSPRLVVHKLGFTFPSYPGLPAQRLFHGLELSISPGEMRVVLGQPESGKTSLSRILTGLIPRYSGGELEGEIRLDDTPLESVTPPQIMDRVGTIFQDPDEQIFTTSCESEAAFALESLGFDPEEIRARVDEALALTGLSSYSRRPPSSLSGGEKKKLLFAALFALEPRLWILDEPLDEVDRYSSRRILSAVEGGGYGVLLFASKLLDIFDEHDMRYSLLTEGRILSEEEVGRKELIEKARSLGLAHPASFVARELYPSHDFHPETEGPSETAGPTETADPGGLRTSEVEMPAAEQPAPLLSVREVEFTYGDSKKGEAEGNSDSGAGAGAGAATSGEPEEFYLRVDALDLYPGETAALVGPNGCGKTTLAKLLCGLLTPKRGHIRGTADLRLETQVAYIFQNPDYQIFLPTVEEELAYGLREQGLAPRDIHRRVREAAEMFRLPPLNVPPTVMSYGARKRLQAAVYYLLDRRVYIIDEADSGISLSDFSEMIAALRREDRAILIITHNDRIGNRYADRSITMEEGRIA